MSGKKVVCLQLLPSVIFNGVCELMIKIVFLTGLTKNENLNSFRRDGYSIFVSKFNYMT